MFQILLFGVSQGSILGPLLLNIFVNNSFRKRRTAPQFSDDNTIATFSNSVDDFITELHKESEKAIDWFRRNEMVVNPDKFQSIIISRLGKLKDTYKLQIDNHKIIRLFIRIIKLLDAIGVVLVSLLLTLNMFHTLF